MINNSLQVKVEPRTGKVKGDRVMVCIWCLNAICTYTTSAAASRCVTQNGSHNRLNLLEGNTSNYAVTCIHWNL